MNKLWKITFASLLVLVTIISCDKDGNEIEDEKIQTERIEDIIPKQYLDTLEKLNFAIHKGVKPPILNGKFAFRPSVLDTSNIATDIPGYHFLDGVVSLFGQNNNDFSINLLGENFISYADTSISTAVSGTGNAFTVYGKVKSNFGNYYATLALLISGELDDVGNIKNAQAGIIMVDDSQGGGAFIKNGQARIAYDSDYLSERVGEAEKEAKTINKTGKALSYRILER